MQRLRRGVFLLLWSGNEGPWKIGCPFIMPSLLCLQIRVIKQAFYSVTRANTISEMFPHHYNPPPRKD